MRIAGNLPLLPHLLIVRGETRRIWATSRTVSRSGKLSIDIFCCGILFKITNYLYRM